MKRCDLHTHSNCSDGSLSPRELVLAAKECGLSAVALTDHNTVAGLREFLDTGKQEGIETVAGCEFTTAYNGTELHLVGLFLPPDAWAAIDVPLQKQREEKHRNNDLLLERLRANGYAITRAEVEALTHSEEFNRNPVAHVLVSMGYVASTQEAFDTLLSESVGFYVPGKRPDTLSVIRFLKPFGVVTVLAHPFLNMDAQTLCDFLPHAVDAGLDAMETHYTDFDAQKTAEAQRIAAHFGLLESGGSDFHGTRKAHVLLGTGKGSLCVPYDFYEKLAARAGG